MEKKRSPRSSPGILPKSPLVYEKYRASCAWRLINFFDFRQGRSGRRLISDKSSRFRDSAGNVYTNSQLDLLRRLHEKCRCTNNANDHRILEEDISCRPKMKRRSSVSGTERKSDPKPVREEPERETRRTKHLKEETFDSLIQGQGKVGFSEQKQSSSTEIEKSERTARMNDEQMGVNKGRNQCRENVDPDFDKCAEINLHVRVNEVAETLICQKGNKGKGFGRDKPSDRSKQFLEALDVLSSNKELFVTLLQDPNSFSAKCGQDLQGSRSKDREAKSSSKAESFETSMKSDDLDRIVLLKPKVTSLGEDSAYLRFKHLAKKLKLVVGSNKNDSSRENKLLHSIYSSEDSCEASETETVTTAHRKSDASKRTEKRSDERDSRRKSDASTSTVGHRSSELPVFKRKKRVESDVFKLSPEHDVSPRRLMVERQHERASPLPVYEVPHVLSSLLREHDDVGASPEMRFNERNQRLGNEKQRYRLKSPGKNIDVFNPKHGYHLRSSDECNISECLNEDGCRGSAAYRSLRPDMEDECAEQRDSQSSCAESCKDNHSTILETNTLFSDFSSPERPNSNVNDLKQEQEHPSPVSVLARVHMEDDTASPGNAKPPSTEERIGLSSDPCIDLKSIFERGSVQELVKIVLETSGLNWTELLARCTVSSLESSLVHQFSHSNSNSNNNDDEGDHQQRLVLDYTSEILRETYRQDIKKSWPFTPLKNRRLAPCALRNDLVHQATKRFDLSLLCGSDPPRTLDELMERDLTKPCEWLDFGGETESVVSDVVEHVLEQLEMEMATELGTMPKDRDINTFTNL